MSYRCAVSGTAARRTAYALLAAWMFWLPAAPAAAQVKRAETFIKNVGVRIVAALSAPTTEARTRRFYGVFDRYANVGAVAEFSLGKYSGKMTGAQRSEYLRLAKRYIVDTLLGGLYGYQIKGVEVTGITEQGRFLTVSSRFIFPDNSSSPVKWRLLKTGGSFRIVDLNVYGIWFALRHRTEFVGIISYANGDTEALIKHLKKKTGQK